MTYAQVVAPGVPGSQGPALISGGPAFSGQPSPQFKALQSGASSLVGDIGEVAGYIIGVPELTVLNAFGANLTNVSTVGKVGGLTIYAPTPHVAREAGTLGLEAGALAVSVVVLPEIGIGTVASLAGVGAANVVAAAVLSPQGIGKISPQQALTAFAEGEAFAAGFSAVGSVVTSFGSSAGPLTTLARGGGYVLTRTGSTLVSAAVGGGVGFVTSGGNVEQAGESAVTAGAFVALAGPVARAVGDLGGDLLYPSGESPTVQGFKISGTYRVLSSAGSYLGDLLGGGKSSFVNIPAPDLGVEYYGGEDDLTDNQVTQGSTQALRLKAENPIAVATVNSGETLSTELSADFMGTGETPILQNRTPGLRFSPDYLSSETAGIKVNLIAQSEILAPEAKSDLETGILQQGETEGLKYSQTTPRPSAPAGVDINRIDINQTLAPELSIEPITPELSKTVDISAPETTIGYEQFSGTQGPTFEPNYLGSIKPTPGDLKAGALSFTTPDSPLPGYRIATPDQAAVSADDIIGFFKNAEGELTEGPRPETESETGLRLASDTTGKGSLSYTRPSVFSEGLTDYFQSESGEGISPAEEIFTKDEMRTDIGSATGREAQTGSLKPRSAMKNLYSFEESPAIKIQDLTDTGEEKPSTNFFKQQAETRYLQTTTTESSVETDTEEQQRFIAKLRIDFETSQANRSAYSYRASTGRNNATEYDYLTTPASATSPLVDFYTRIKSTPVMVSAVSLVTGSRSAIGTASVSVTKQGTQSRNITITGIGLVDPLKSSVLPTRTSLVSTAIGISTFQVSTEGLDTSSLLDTELSLRTVALLQTSLGLSQVQVQRTPLLTPLLTVGIPQPTTTSVTTTPAPNPNPATNPNPEEDLLAFPFVSFVPSTSSVERGGGAPENYLPFPPLEKRRKYRPPRRGRFVDYTIRNQLSENVLEGFGEYAEDLLGSSSGYLDSLLGRGRGRRRSKKAKASPKRRARGRR